MFEHVKLPAVGEKITVNADYSAERSRPADRALYRGRWHGSRHHAGDDQGRRRRGGEGLRRQEEDPVDGDLRRREVDSRLRSRRLAASRDVADPQGIRGLDQGTADDAGRWRHPLAQRRVAPGTRPLRLPATGALLHGRAESGEGAREGRHGDLPRELRRHLCRHRIRGRVRPGEEADRLPDEGHGRQGRSASRPRPASASSRCHARAPSASCGRRSSTRSTTTSHR